jgi:serine O-acetyltransferase
MSTCGAHGGRERKGSGVLSTLALLAGTYGLARYTKTGRSLKEAVRHDIDVIKERDPAARNELEIVTCYPGLHALWIHRLSSALWRRDIPVLPRLLSQAGRLVTGVEIHPGARIGKGLFIDHGAGVVIGETADIGENVTMYQGVTLGGTGKETGKRHPTVGSNVVIGAGSQLLGSIRVGDNAKIGAGSVVVRDVPANTTVVGNPGHPVVMDGTRIGIPDIDYSRLPDPVAEAMKCLVRRVVQLENELDEIRRDGAAGDAAGAAGNGGQPASDEACDPVRLEGLPEI